MAKGFGHVIAEVNAILNPPPDDAIFCPACGEVMAGGDLSIERWFCYGGPPHNQRCAELETLAQVFWAHADETVRAAGHSVDAFQGQTLAALVMNSKAVAYFATVRGGGGATNLFVAPLPGVDMDEVIAMVKNPRSRWIWADWVKAGLGL